MNETTPALPAEMIVELQSVIAFLRENRALSLATLIEYLALKLEKPAPPAPDPIVVKALRMGLDWMSRDYHEESDFTDFRGKYGCPPMSYETNAIFLAALAKLGVPHD